MENPCEDPLIDYLLGLLDEEGMRVVDRHLALCPKCLASLSDFSLVGPCPDEVPSPWREARAATGRRELRFSRVAPRS